MTETVTIPIEFTIGTLRELGLGGFRQGWVDSENDGMQLSLSCGAGVGNFQLDASCRPATGDGEGLYARASIRPLAETIFAELERRVRAAAGDPETRGEPQ